MNKRRESIMTTHFHKKPNMYTSHIQLKVSNLARSLEFYKTIIGFQVLEQSEDTAYLTVDGKKSLVSLLQVDNALSLRRGQTGLYHMAILLPTKKDLGNLVNHFSDLNVRIGAGDHHVSEALYLNDPDGNGIEVYIDRQEDTWIWKNDSVYMTVEQVDFGPIMAAADGNWLGLPEDTVMGHVHLSVANIDATRKFYTEVLDYKVVSEYDGNAIFVSTGKYHHHLAFNIWNGSNGVPAAVNSVGLKSFTIVLKDKEYANEVKNKVKESAYPVEIYEEGPKYGGTQSFSTIDPNGFRILFTIDGE